MALVFDKAAALERVCNDIPLLKDLIGLCREQCDAGMMPLMHEARRKNVTDVEKRSHFLAGALGNVGAMAAYEAAQKLGRAAQHNQVEDLEKLAEGLFEQINQFFLAIEREL